MRRTLKEKYAANSAYGRGAPRPPVVRVPGRRGLDTPIFWRLWHEWDDRYRAIVR